MSTFQKLFSIRSQLVEEVLDYLRTVARRAAVLPQYFPAHLRVNQTGETQFDHIRQMVQVVEDRKAFEQWLKEEAQAREQARAAGHEVEHMAYHPRRGRPEMDDPNRSKDREEEWREPDRKPPPPPIPWDEQASKRYPRSILVADPGQGKTWVARWTARHLARAAIKGLESIRLG